MAFAMRSTAHRLSSLISPVIKRAAQPAALERIVIQSSRTFSTSIKSTVTTSAKKPSLFSTLFRRAPAQAYVHGVRTATLQTTEAVRYKSYFLFSAKFDKANSSRQRSYGSTGLVALAVALCAANNNEQAVDGSTYELVPDSAEVPAFHDDKQGEAQVSALPTLLSTVLSYLIRDVQQQQQQQPTQCLQQQLATPVVQAPVEVVSVKPVSYFTKFVQGDCLTITSKNVQTLQHWQAVAQFLHYSPHVSTVYVKSVSIDLSVISVLLEYGGLMNVKHIKMYENELGVNTGTTAALTQLLTHSTRLTSLAIVRNSLTVDDMKAICKLVESSKTLAALNLSYNGLCNQSAMLLANTLHTTAEHSALRDIDLRMNCLSAAGKQELRSVQGILSAYHHIWLEIVFQPMRVLMARVDQSLQDAKEGIQRRQTETTAAMANLVHNVERRRAENDALLCN